MAKVWYLIIVTIAFVLTAISILGIVRASTLTSITIELLNPIINASSQYNISVSNQSASLIRCITVRFTDNTGVNSPISGVDLTSSTLNASSNFVPTPGSWSLSASNATGVVTLTNAVGEVPLGGASRTLILNAIENGDTAGTSYWAEVKSYSNVGCSTLVDEGIGAFVYTQGVTVSAFVPEELDLALSAGSCAFGILSPALTKTCTINITARTNSPNGYSLAYVSSTTLTHSANQDTITPIGASSAISSIGTEQFGFNLVANTTPFVGANPSGGTGVPLVNYVTPDQFAFITSGATIASSAGPTVNTVFTASYIANISSSTVSGDYSATQTLLLTANP